MLAARGVALEVIRELQRTADLASGAPPALQRVLERRFHGASVRCRVVGRAAQPGCEGVRRVAIEVLVGGHVR